MAFKKLYSKSYIKDQLYTIGYIICSKKETMTE